MILESKMFRIPIEKYEKDLDTYLSRTKKQEILEIFLNHNNLCSEEEFEEIEKDLHEACKFCDTHLIKIYLSEKIQNASKDKTFKIDKTAKTASLFEVNSNNKQLVIPRSFQRKSTEYLITSISRIYCSIQSIKFVEDSAVNTIYFGAFFGSGIEEIYFPSSLRELKEGWCNETRKLTKIIISPSNDQFIFNNDKCLLGKTDPNSDEFDNLLFAARDIKELFIPSNIKIISPYAFNYCEKLTKFEIPPNSNLQTIGSYAFNYSKIREIFIPSKVSKICEGAFHSCYNLKKVEIPSNSNLKTIEKEAFAASEIEEIYFPSSLRELKKGWCFGANKLTKIIISPSNDQFIFNNDKCLLGKTDPKSDEFDNLLFAARDIKEFFIPSNIKIISPYAFNNCENLTKINISPNSNLRTIDSNAFYNSIIKEICIPSRVSKICEGAFYGCQNLTKVIIQSNSDLRIIEKFAFSWTKIKSIFIPSKVSIISEKAFFICDKLQIVEISRESKSKLFLLSAFSGCQNLIIMIPS